ncbi:MAG TPA: ShlB/FhaC/HecB family hemolysin secretion/activation protein [Phycisphaerales bacterium]|nr:ShlB/FhaC/HecB family hemolysin secretion/activation protein [Phycisphaerales bacterium]
MAPVALSAVAVSVAAGLPTSVQAQGTSAHGQVGRLVEAYPFSRLRLEYASAHPEVPLIESLASMPISLDVSGDTIRVAEAGADPIKLGQVLSVRDRKITASAINEIARTVVAELNRRGIVGVLVAPDPAMIDPTTGADLRQDGEDLALKVWVGLVTDVRTVGTGSRLSEVPAVNHPVHRRIGLLSPAKPWHEGDRGARRDLIRRDVLDDYVFRLNRHPGRRVDLAISAATGEHEPPNAVTLDYLIRETKPWMVYGQISNTGTSNTSEWRERLGLVHNQLTNRDDTLRVDLVTSSFEDSYAAVISYEAPLPGTDLIRAKVYGNWSDYTASDIGLPGQDLSGTTWTFGGELIANVYQRKSLFADVFAGVRQERIEVTNDVAGTKGDTDFLIGTVGVRVDERVPTRSIYGEVAIDFTLDGGDPTEIPGLGRLRADDSWTVLRWTGGSSFFLEPLFWPNAWQDEHSTGSSLANEIAVRFSGQSSLGTRLIPQQQQVVGGLYTVRGYPQSAVAGDSAIIGSVEYRLHVPQLLGTSAEVGTLFGEPFRYQPDRPYGMADWDLILAAFVDFGQTSVEDADSFEFDEQLIGAGVGIGLEFKRNVRVRVDWGVALNDLDDGSVQSGDSEIHVVGTLAF